MICQGMFGNGVKIGMVVILRLQFLILLVLKLVASVCIVVEAQPVQPQVLVVLLYVIVEFLLLLVIPLVCALLYNFFGGVIVPAYRYQLVGWRFFNSYEW